MRTFWFGKYKDRNVADICKSDKSYIRWCLDNVKGFSLTDEETEAYKTTSRRLVHHYDNEGSVWDDFDDEMTYGMMMDLD